MDREEARFVLRCFRPDGSDAADPEFSEALQLAAADRDLGDWLAKERAQDADFSAMLARLPLQEGLREEIMAGLATERGKLPQADAIDASLIGALATVRPPLELRDQIIAAMERSIPEERAEASSWWRFSVPAAAAAGIALAIVLSNDRPKTDLAESGSNEQSRYTAVPVSFVQSEAIATLDSPDFSLDLTNQDQKALFEFIRSEGRACPSGCVPSGLKSVPGLGCRVIEFDGKPGAIVCFQRGVDEIVHLVIFKRSDVSGELPDVGHPEFEQQGDWAIARWEEEGRAFLMLSRTVSSRLGGLF